ncbi:ABC transporter permease [Compostibacter hankyongensis]|uniref:ABC transporter permease n=1 Tax=Compostibacter hankyongensis TaxID=1007089 RepID=A0ABP8FCY3_9BACT
MFGNYLKTAWRSLRRSKSFSFINIGGLAIGMAATVFILLWVRNELTFDRYYPDTDRLYQVFNRQTSNGETHAWSSSPGPMAPALKSDYPEVEGAVRTMGAGFLLEAQDKKLKAGGMFVDPGFISMFSFPMTAGKAGLALDNIDHIVITETLAKKLFGNGTAVGQRIRLANRDDFMVSGVLKDLPSNTRFQFEYLLPWSYSEKIYGKEDSWTANNVRTYVLLKKGASLEQLSRKIKDITVTRGGLKGVQLTQFLYPARRWHLYEKEENGQMVGGTIEKVKLFCIIAGFILLIACINFMNLSTARSEKRAREVGIRKVAGAPKSVLIVQFMTEGLLLSGIAGVIAFLLVWFLLPAYNKLLGMRLSLNMGGAGFLVSLLGLILVTGLLAGSYPAFFLSSFSPTKVLKGTFRGTGKLITPRKALVVVQFTFAIALIVSTGIVYRQIKYVQDRDAGYDRDQLLYSSLEGKSGQNFELIKRDLLSSGSVTSVTKSMGPVTDWTSNMWGYEWNGSTREEAQLSFDVFSTDADFARTMGTKIIKGRDIDVHSYPTDSTAILLNETAVKVMHLKDPIGQTVKRIGEENWHVVGVVKDFIVGSPYDDIPPMIIMGPSSEWSWFNAMHYRLNPSRPVKENLSEIERIFKKYNPEYPFEYHFTDESYAAKFRTEQTTGALAILFSVLAIFISCLGLFGLAAYMAETRIKEIGVRKVLGASVANITVLLSRDFLKLVLVSIIIASPVAWWVMHQWLQSFTYREQISLWIFIVSGAAAITIALATVGFQSVKAATANPVKSLRAE